MVCYPIVYLYNWVIVRYQIDIGIWQTEFYSETVLHVCINYGIGQDFRHYKFSRVSGTEIR